VAACKHYHAQGLEQWRGYFLLLIHRVALGLYMVKRRDLDVLETVTDITTSILERRWWWAEHVRAGVPPPCQQARTMSFRLQVALEFDPATWRQSAEGMLSEMKIVLAHLEQSRNVY
ncbi:unnamed protein product, partial [Symbiodinium sp. CCMP2456]